MQDEDQLFDIELPPPVSLADRFVMPPLSVLDRRSGEWTDRKRRWLSLGFESELGREEEVGFLNAAKVGHGGAMEDILGDRGGAVSVFDPVLAELAYRWFSPTGGRVLDPFAGGSVRGLVASHLQRDYVGIDLSEEQVLANKRQMHLALSGFSPMWLQGDSRKVLRDLFLYEADFIFTCPPYHDLEVYSDHPADLSNMDYDWFIEGYFDIIAKACDYLKPNRFAAIVVSDVRDKKGNYKGLTLDTVRAFEGAGLHLYNDLMIVDPIGTHAILAAKQFIASRKVRRTHQHMLVFVKGDGKEATRACQG